MFRVKQGRASMATPHAAGVAALLMSARPNARVTDIMGAMRDTAHHPGGLQARPDNRYGWGILRPTDALAAL
jgi:subtilisin family serine protease